MPGGDHAAYVTSRHSARTALDAVQGRKGERFVYLTWGTVAGDTFTMFRRAKLMLADLPSAQEVHVDVHLTDENGMPRCARLRPPAIRVRQPTS